MLAVGSPKRAPLFPEVPTLDEVGLKGFDADTVFGFYAPAGTPADVIVKRLNGEINRILGTAGAARAHRRARRRAGADDAGGVREPRRPKTPALRRDHPRAQDRRRLRAAPQSWQFQAGFAQVEHLAQSSVGANISMTSNFQDWTTYKPWPSCRWTQYPLTAFLALKAEFSLRPEEIQHIVVRANPFSVSPRFRTVHPENSISSEFSHANIMAVAAHGVPPGPLWHEPSTIEAPSMKSFACYFKARNTFSAVADASIRTAPPPFAAAG